ncbi:MAG: LamB/YcsF family protein [Actinomycetota bacterium]|nr:LamB/YcsF family protein [Actinomycetota bacterium]
MAIDLNADLGEGFGQWRLTDDDALLEVVTSANVACGFHAGDPSIMRRVTRRAVERGVRIGAQVAYRDLAGFGRRSMDVEPATLRDDVLYQFGALQAMAEAAGGEVSYLKPHGALYNRIVWDEPQAGAVAEAVATVRPGLAVLSLPEGAFARAAAAAGLRVVAEAYPDRGYLADGTLVPRSEPGALVVGAEVVAARSARMALDGLVTALDGSEVELHPESLCLHGDSPGAAATARSVRSTLEAAGVTLRPFV